MFESTGRPNDLPTPAFLKAGEHCLSIQKIETLVYLADGLYDLSEVLYLKQDEESV